MYEYNMDVKCGDIIMNIFFLLCRMENGKIPYITHNNLVHLINKSCSITSVGVLNVYGP